MKTLSMCRICMSVDVRMHYLINTKLHELYEMLTAISFETKDSRPSHVCYMCYARLRNCYMLRVTCLQSEDLFTHMLENNQCEPKIYQNTMKLEIAHPVILLSNICTATDAFVDRSIENKIKKEPSIVKDEVVVKEEVFDKENSIVEQETQHSRSEELPNNYILKTEDGILDYNEQSMEVDGSAFPEMASYSLLNNVKFEHNIQRKHSRNKSINDESVRDQICPKIVKIQLEDIKLSNPKFQQLDIVKMEKDHPSTYSTEDEVDICFNENNNNVNKLHSINKTTEKEFKHQPIKLCIYNGVVQYKCDVCGMYFSQQDELNIHKGLHHSKKIYNCHVCQKVYKKNSDLMKHVHKHNSVKLRCDICQKCFSCKEDISRHMSLHNCENKYKCDVCDKSYSKARNLKIHMMVHNEKPFQCDICEKFFTLETNLRRHYDIHISKKSFKCNICEKSFNRKSSLSKHMCIHTGEKPYQCEFCPKAFTSKSNLNSHTNTHSGAKPYKCDICEKCFREKGHLKTHIRIHTGDKPYSCNFCDKRYSNQSHLITHVRKHTGEKPYKCDICTKRYSNKSHLNLHVRIHSGVKLYNCLKCNKSYGYKRSLKAHVCTESEEKS